MRRKNRNKANRGKELERLIDYQNKMYDTKGVAYIRKVPTNVRILRTHRNGTLSGHLMAGEFCDYVGVYKGRAIEFDAKQTKGKSLPFSNVRENQEAALKKVHELGGRAFLIVRFTELGRYFRLNWEDYEYIKKNTKRKSLSLKHFEEYAHEIKEGANGEVLDYLEGGG